MTLPLAFGLWVGAVVVVLAWLSLTKHRDAMLALAAKTPEQRFWPKVDKRGPDDCWEWTATRTTAGYGRFQYEGRQQQAHRVSYLWLRGPIPEGLDLDHLCRNRACVNPAHLEAVTRRVNVLRGTGPSAVHATKTHCPQGHPFDEVNTYLRPGSGARMCRACRVVAWRRLEEKRKRARHAVKHRDIG